MRRRSGLSAEPLPDRVWVLALIPAVVALAAFAWDLLALGR
jgi:hypothetical protein